MSLYESTVRIPAVLAVDASVAEGEQDLVFEIRYQACNDVTCMSPETMLLNTKISIKASEADVASSENSREIVPEEQVEKIVPETANTKNTGSTTIIKEEPVQDQDEKENPFKNKNILVVLLIVFVMGLALNLTPCVYPLIPITMGYFLAQKNTVTGASGCDVCAGIGDHVFHYRDPCRVRRFHDGLFAGASGHIDFLCCPDAGVIAEYVRTV